MNESGHRQLIPKVRTCGVSLHSAYTRTSSWSGAIEQNKYRRFPPPILHYHHHHHHLQWVVLASLFKNSTQYFFFHILFYIFHSGLSKCNGKIFNKFAFTHCVQFWYLIVLSRILNLLSDRRPYQQSTLLYCATALRNLVSAVLVEDILDVKYERCLR